jgi:DNA-binding response OmpR family regulator
MKNDEAPKILIVDDEQPITLALLYLFEKEGFDVRVAADGKEAIEILGSFKPAVIILDVMMPDISGFEVAKEIFGLDLCSEIKIIFLTAKSAELDRKTGFESGGEYYFTKPFDNDSLVTTVKEILDYG